MRALLTWNSHQRKCLNYCQVHVQLYLYRKFFNIRGQWITGFFIGDSKKEQVEKVFNEITINTIQQIESQQTVHKVKNDGDTQEAIEVKISQDFGQDFSQDFGYARQEEQNLVKGKVKQTQSHRQVDVETIHVNNNNCTNLNEDKTKNDYRFLSKFLM